MTCSRIYARGDTLYKAPNGPFSQIRSHIITYFTQRLQYKRILYTWMHITDPSISAGNIPVSHFFPVHPMEQLHVSGREHSPPFRHSSVQMAEEDGQVNNNN